MFGYIPKFDTNIFDMKKTKRDLPSVEQVKFTKSVLFKKTVTDNQDHLPLQHMFKKMLFHPLKTLFTIPGWLYDLTVA